MLHIQCQLSIIGCFSVLLSFLIFFSTELTNKDGKRKSQYNILCYIFLSSILTAMGSVYGGGPQGSFVCWWEGLLTNIFTLSSIMWCVTIFLKLYTLVGWEKTTLNIDAWYVHCVCWGVPLLASLLPLTNSTYGPPPGSGEVTTGSGEAWCWISPTDNSPPWAQEFWYWFSFYFWVWSAFVALIVLTGLLLWKLKLASDMTKKNFQKAYRQVIFYPLLIFLCWFPSSLYDFFNYYFPESYVAKDSFYQRSSSFIAAATGFLLSINFWVTADRIKTQWKLLARAGFDYRLYIQIGRRNKHESESLNSSSERVSSARMTKAAGSGGATSSSTIVMGNPVKSTEMSPTNKRATMVLISK
jgi:hypothetical protein